MPKDTRKILGDGAQKCESRSLLQQKLVFFENKEDIPEYKQISLGFILSNGKKNLDKLLNNKVTIKQTAESKKNTQSKRYSQACAFINKTRGILSNRNPLALKDTISWHNNIPSSRRRSFELRTADRLIIGQADGVLENCGITIHRFFGIPYLPGSALKGISRNAARTIPYTNKEMLAIFGNDNDSDPVQGGIGFLAAFPVDKNAQLEYDICTPHYTAYYGHTKKLGKDINPHALDIESPIPNVFPVVAKGVKFQFNLVCIDKRFNDNRAGNLLDLAVKALKTALIENGVGAKTAAGYGRFEEISNTHTEQPDAVGNTVSDEDAIIVKWRGKVTQGNFNVILNDLSAITDIDRLKKVFESIMPPSQNKQDKLKRTNPFWQSFSARPQGKKVLEKLNIKLG